MQRCIQPLHAKYAKHNTFNMMVRVRERQALRVIRAYVFDLHKVSNDRSMIDPHPVPNGTYLFETNPFATRPYETAIRYVCPTMYFPL